MKIVISNHSELPIYAQVKEQIKEQIMTGVILEGTKLPSIRQLAKDLKISVITITRAYSELESEGYIATMQGKGSVVLGRDNDLLREQYLRRIEEALETAIETARFLKLSNEELIDMLGNLIDDE
ncbi:MAG: GntR family transcriptional regulator [Lachnospiraceae bacterium]|nr:GntR family transcriptional regulator [Lachnospiraceae bacterium]MDD3615396.1 GntR family transcriptional regulator [Lachnospiraceae bacterium]